MSVAACAVAQPKWLVVPLGDVCQKTETVNPGKAPSEEFTYVDVSSVSNQTFSVEAPTRILGRDAPSRARRLVRTGDVIFATVRPTLLRVAHVPALLDGAVCSTGYIVLRPKPELDARFLFYSLFRLGFQSAMESLQSGASYPAVNDGQVLTQTIPLPPLEEQKRIVAVLDQAFAALDRARANAEANLADALELQRNALDTEFQRLAQSEQMMPLADAVHVDCKLSYGIVQPGDDVEGGLPVVRPVDLKTRVITTESLKTIAPERAAGYARTQLVGGELLLCVRGSTGEVCVAADDLAGCNVTRGIVPIRFDAASVLPEFAFFQFRSRFVRDQIAAKTYGAALMQINIKDLRELHFLVPPITVQKEVVVRAESFSDTSARLGANYEAELADLAALRQTLLQKAFAGELA